MKTLGIDLGTNSLGWAVVEKGEEEYKLLEKGVRIFQEGVKFEKGSEKSKAAERTSYRSARRIKYRRKLRKIEVLRVLTEYGYCPPLTKKELNDWRYKKVYPINTDLREWWLTDEFTGKTPYAYRNIAVMKKLDLEVKEDRFLLGRVFYHMAQRRGFLSNRLEGKKESEGVVKKGIDEITKRKGDLTLGQYFYNKLLKGEKIRDSYTHRENHYLEEFIRICEFQNLPDDLVLKVKRAIFYQRPLRSQRGLVGKCVFEKNKPRCSVSRPEFEEYRMWSFINNIKIKTPDDDKMRKLNGSERERIKHLFYRKKTSFSFEDIAKLLSTGKQYKSYKSKNIFPEDWLFNYGMDKTVMGCPVSSRLKSVFGEDFMNLKVEYIREKDKRVSFIVINDVWHVLYTFDNEEKLRDFFIRRLKLNDEQLKELFRISLKNDYASLSLKAIRKILPYLKEGLIYSHAVFLANMGSALPDKIWNNEDNKKIVQDEIYNLIKTQNEEKQIVEIVNAMVKTNRDNNNTWSTEAIDLYKRDMQVRIESKIDKQRFVEYTDLRKSDIFKRAFSLFEQQMNKNSGRGEFARIKRIDERVKDFLIDNFNIPVDKLKKIYHPAAIEVYKPPFRKDDGRLYLGSPLITSIRNPMAMRALHQLRLVVNDLIGNDVIDENTKVTIEMARGLMNANERKAYQSWQDEREKERKKHTESIKEYFGDNYEPSDTEILKYQLWEEQNHKCLYTGREIGIAAFLGPNPEFDIEHTIPRSLSLDNSQVNKTLCDKSFNRSIKRNQIPAKLKNHSEIVERIEHWQNKVDDLEKQINYVVRKSKSLEDKDARDKAIQNRHKLTYRRSYWKEKYRRFVMKDVPDGFKNSQLVDTGIITKYSRLYLKTVFSKVYTVKGSIVSDFRKIWGIQEEYKSKTRVNHIHHCVDAITIACISKQEYENLAIFYHNRERAFIKGVGQLPPVRKPWRTFAKDVRSVVHEVLISHYTPDSLPKQTKRKVRKRGRIQYNKNGLPKYMQGDTVRGSLHKETYYGAIETEVNNKDGIKEKKIKYVVRKPLDTLDDKLVKNIVDEKIRNIVLEARKKEKQIRKDIEQLNKKLKNVEEAEEEKLLKKIVALKNEIESLYVLPNKNGNPVPIKKVRLFQPNVTTPLKLKTHRDKSLNSRKEYKEQYHVVNDSNYLMAIYEGTVNNKTKRGFKIVNNLEAGEFFKLSVKKVLKAQGLSGLSGLIPFEKGIGSSFLKLKSILKIGTLIILWEGKPKEIWELTNEDLKKRLYKVTGLSEQVVQGKYHFGTIVLRHVNEARPASELKIQDGVFKANEEYKAQRKMNHNQFNALVEGFDFKLSSIGVITSINKL